MPLAADVPYAALYDGSAPAQPVTDHAVGEFLRCAMGLSAWKQYGQSRWALRVNPSSGNLHPTEAWIVRDGCVSHYGAKDHILEQRCVFDTPNATAPGHAFLVALTSIVWREAWKYGERAFRYCQHDTGHAIAALRLAASMLGWQLRLLPSWADAQIAAVLGLDRDADYDGAEREEPECMALVGRNLDVCAADPAFQPAAVIEAVQRGVWAGRANRLSRAHVEWPAIDRIVQATRYPGAGEDGSARGERTSFELRSARSPVLAPQAGDGASAARDVILRRRSALAFNPRGWLRRDTFLQMLQRLWPGSVPWDAIDWRPNVHLILFVHRVEDVTPGVYAWLRQPDVVDEWKAAMRSEFLWEPVSPHQESLFLLLPIDAGRIANRLSCDQDIAEDGFFSLGMLARFEAPLQERGDWFYRRLFWESGLIGQVLYLEAEAAGARATGIGCYYDDPVHELLGLTGHAWQSLYHFSMGLPVEDTRLTSEPGYEWET